MKKEIKNGSELHSASQSDTRTRSEPRIRRYTINNKNRQDVLINVESLKNSMTKKLDGGEFLRLLRESLNFTDDNPTKYLLQKVEGKLIELRISNHCAAAEDAKDRDKSTSVVIKQLRGKNAPRFRKSKYSEMIEFVYYPENLTLEKEIGIISGIADWIKCGEYTYRFEDELHISKKTE